MMDHKRSGLQSKRITLGLFIFYLIALTWIIIFKAQLSFESLPHIRNINLIPFSEPVIINGKPYLKEIFLNVLAFIPLGLFIHVLWEQKSLLIRILPIISTSLLFEAIQYTFAIGASDITDVISNSLGGIIGVIIAVVLSKISSKNWIKIINIFCLIGAVLSTLFFAILFFANL